MADVDNHFDKNTSKEVNERDTDDEGETVDEYLEGLYYDPLTTGGYTGISKLWLSVKTDGNPHKLKYAQVSEWLNNQNTYKRHKPAQTIFPRQKIIMSEIDQQWDGDIMDMQKFAKFNKGYKFLAIFIDIFSRYAWVEPMKTKTPKEMVSVMQKVFAEGRMPQYFRTDKGSEYIGRLTKDYLHEKRIIHFTAVNAMHANYAERFIRTLKGKLYRYFTKQNTYAYVSILQDFVDSYLDTIHSSTRMRPVDITPSNEQEVYEKLYLPTQLRNEKQPVNYKYSVGDYVHLSLARRVFNKAYWETFTQEIFVISRRIRSHPPRYKVKDLLDEPLEGSVYEAELQAADYNENTAFPIEKVIAYRTKNKGRMAKVRWQGYPQKFDSWIPAGDIEKKKHVFADSLK